MQINYCNVAIFDIFENKYLCISNRKMPDRHFDLFFLQSVCLRHPSKSMNVPFSRKATILREHCRHCIFHKSNRRAPHF